MMNKLWLLSFILSALIVATPHQSASQWKQTSGPIVGNAFASVRAVYVKHDALFAGTQTGGIFMSQDKGDTWKAVNSGLPSVAVFSLAMSDKTLFAGIENGVTGGGGGVYQSDDSGATWKQAAGTPLNCPINAMAIADSVLYAGSWNAKIFRLPSDGLKWTDITVGLPKDQIVGIEVHGTDVYAATYRSGVWRSADHGQSWMLAAPVIGGKSLQAIAIIDTNIFAGLLGGIYRLNENRTVWKEITKGLFSSGVTSFCKSGSMLFAGTMGGVFLSADLGESWIDTGLKGISIYALAVSGTDLFAATNTNGVWRRPLIEFTNGPLLGVEKIESSVLGSYALCQNYPNPANPSTTISFTLPFRSLVNLNIYDVLGKEVETLANEELPAGAYSRTWNAGAMPSGVYFYRLQAGGHSETKRLVLLR